MWPENWPAFELFSLMETQWNVGLNGAQGLNYSVLFELMRRADVSDADWLDMFKDIRHMEAEALKEIRKQRNAK